ncbi:MAG: helix-turn-helix transcriptional regulator [Bacteroidota bacterium]
MKYHNDYSLTKRELEVLGKMADGHTQKEIAAILFVSPNTINSHTQHIYSKLDVNTGMHAVAKALRAKIID